MDTKSLIDLSLAESLGEGVIGEGLCLPTRNEYSGCGGVETACVHSDEEEIKTEPSSNA
jgi:hypothetical protein